MERRRFTMLGVMLAVLAGIAVLTQVGIPSAPAQGTVDKPKVTGSVVEKVIKDLGNVNLPGVKTVKYMRLTMAPGAKMENAPMDDGTDFCEAKKGAIFVTLPDGTKVSHKAGDIFTIPLGLKTKLITVSAKDGYDEFFWRIFPQK